MKVRADSLGLSKMYEVLRLLNTVYEDNVRWKREPEWKNGWIHFTLRVASSRGPGHSRAFYQGRRSVAACWHTHRDFMRILFTLYPDAVLVSRMARYEGADGFRRTFNATGYANRGSMMQPLCARDACDCYEHADSPDRGLATLQMLSDRVGPQVRAVA